jgi:hypothetical protein
MAAQIEQRGCWNPVHDGSRNTGTASERTGGSSNVAKCWLGRLIGSCDIVRNPRLKSDRDRSRRRPALQGEVAGADQMAHRAVADSNRQAPQPHTGPRAMRLEALGGRRLETRYIWWVIFRQRVSAGSSGWCHTKERPLRAR